MGCKLGTLGSHVLVSPAMYVCMYVCIYIYIYMYVYDNLDHSGYMARHNASHVPGSGAAVHNDTVNSIVQKVGGRGAKPTC